MKNLRGTENCVNCEHLQRQGRHTICALDKELITTGSPMAMTLVCDQYQKWEGEKK